MIIGVSGSRHGMTLAQMTAVTRELYHRVRYPDAVELHHNDDIGTAVQVAAIAAGLGYWTVAHPPLNGQWRGWHPSDEIRPLKDHHERDREIAQRVELLIACPWTIPQQSVSGTWSTIRYARSIGRPVLLVCPESGELIDYEAAA